LLIAPAFPESSSVFASRYSGYVAEDAHVASAHAGIARLVQRLPQAAGVDAAGVLHERHRWSEAHRHRRPAGR